MSAADPSRCPTCDGRLSWGGMGWIPHGPERCAHRLRYARALLLRVLASRPTESIDAFAAARSAALAAGIPDALVEAAATTFQDWGSFTFAYQFEIKTDATGKLLRAVYQAAAKVRGDARQPGGALIMTDSSLRARMSEEQIGRLAGIAYDVTCIAMNAPFRWAQTKAANSETLAMWIEGVRALVERGDESFFTDTKRTANLAALAAVRGCLDMLRAEAPKPVRVARCGAQHPRGAGVGCGRVAGHDGQHKYRSLHW